MLGKIKCDVISVGERQDFMVSWSGSWNNKTLGLRRRPFIFFPVFGTPDETLALVVDIFKTECTK